MNNKYIIIEYNDKFILSKNNFFTDANKDINFLRSNGFKDSKTVLTYIKNNFNIDINNISIINGQF